MYLFLPALLFMTGCIGTDIIDDPEVPERVRISPRIDSLAAGQSIQLFASYFDQTGTEQAQSIEWMSTEPGNVAIDANGLANSLNGGPARIIARAGTAADTLVLNVEGVSNTTLVRSGTFEGRGGYNAEGEARLESQADGSLKLFFASDFSTSPGPSVYILLANHTNGSYSVTNGALEVNASSAQIIPSRMTNFSGEMEFDVPAGVNITDYDFVVLYCIIGPVFGTSSLN